MSGTALFTFLQDAAFYRSFHVAAADLMGTGNGRSWLDVGTGPGLLARLAAERGYRARGIDRSEKMIAAAERLAGKHAVRASFAATDIEAELASGRRYDVVSASSLAVVTTDPARTLVQLKALTAPGGRLLVIEASQKMTRWRAVKMLLTLRLGKRGYMLLLWAMARSGRALDTLLLVRTALRPARHSLLGGMVNAWVMEVTP
ncbi:MAG: class I SAM-dependent methyltransferase [Hyphomicrobium sp.]|jgi:ubiquinone/menaquinone biosynthesis C-methylase UbiE